MKIKVLSKRETITKDGKETTFYRYFTPVQIRVYENGEDKGIQNKSIKVHFTKKCMKKIENEKIFAIFEIESAEDYSLPYVYKIKWNEQKGRAEYPECWIRNFKSMTPLKSKFENTCVPLIDEEDEEPVEIVEE